VTVAAINAVIRDVMFVAERDRLLAGYVDLGKVGGSINGPSKVADSGDDKYRPEDTRARDCIGAAMKDLGHGVSPNRVSRSESSSQYALFVTVVSLRYR
jgi:hypothetical protein